MTIVFADGFEDSAEADYPNAASSISAGNGRRGGKALVFSATSGSEQWATSSQATMFAHVALSPNARVGAFLHFSEGALFHVILYRNADGSISAMRANTATIIGTSGPGVIPDIGYTSIQCKVTIHDTTGTVEVRINGSSTPALNLSNVDTRNSGSGLVSAVGIGAPGGSGGIGAAGTYFDDVVIWDAAGSTNNSWLGDLRVDSYLPTADGDTTTMTTSTGTSHFALVDEVPSSGTDYVESSTVGNKDLYQLADMSHNPETIHAVIPVGQLSKDDAGSRDMALLVKSSSTESDGPSISPSTSSQRYTRVIELDPNGSVAWTKTAFNALQAGVKVVA